jgi:hypothetical protein
MVGGTGDADKEVLTLPPYVRQAQDCANRICKLGEKFLIPDDEDSQ